MLWKGKSFSSELRKEIFPFESERVKNVQRENHPPTATHKIE